jgi:hypothetical protein
VGGRRLGRARAARRPGAVAGGGDPVVGRRLERAASMTRAGIQPGAWQLRPLWRGGRATTGGRRCGGGGRAA